MNVTETVDPVTTPQADALPSKRRRTETDTETVDALSERAFKALVLVVCAWSVIEAPLELGGSAAPADLLALLLSKIVAVGAGLAVIAKAPFAREAFSFLCGTSVFAIATAVPMAINESFAISIASSVECVGKAACVLAFGIASSQENRATRSGSVRNRCVPWKHISEDCGVSHLAQLDSWRQHDHDVH